MYVYTVYICVPLIQTHCCGPPAALRVTEHLISHAAPTGVNVCFAHWKALLQPRAAVEAGAAAPPAAAGGAGGAAAAAAAEPAPLAPAPAGALVAPLDESSLMPAGEQLPPGSYWVCNAVMHPYIDS